MIKNISFFLLFFFITQSQYSAAMKIVFSGQVLYSYLFTLCQEGNIDAIKTIVQQNPGINLNYQNDKGETAALHAAKYGKWEVVWYLLQECGANRMIADDRGQTIFSKAVYWKYSYASNPFKKLLNIYSLEELNSLCQKIGFDRDSAGMITPQVEGFVLDVVNNKKDMSEKNEKGNTALHEACIHAHIPLVVKLIERGASLDTKNRQQNSPYDELKGFSGVAAVIPPFVIREAFNKKGLSFYPDWIDEKVIFARPKARIWQPVCDDACQLAGIEDPDENCRFIKFLKSPRRTLTKINKALALEGK